VLEREKRQNTFVLILIFEKIKDIISTKDQIIWQLLTNIGTST